MGLAVALVGLVVGLLVAVPSSLAVALVVEGPQDRGPSVVPSVPVVAPALVVHPRPSVAVHLVHLRPVVGLAVVRTVPVAVTVDIDSSLARCIVPLPPQRHTAASGHF